MVRRGPPSRASTIAATATAAIPAAAAATAIASAGIGGTTRIPATRSPRTAEFAAAALKTTVGRPAGGSANDVTAIVTEITGIAGTGTPRTMPPPGPEHDQSDDHDDDKQQGNHGMGTPLQKLPS